MLRGRGARPQRWEVVWRPAAERLDLDDAGTEIEPETEVEAAPVQARRRAAMRRRACTPPRLSQDMSAAAAPPAPAPDTPPGAAQSSRRIAALHLPWLPVERRCLTGPAAIWTTEGSRRVLVAVSPDVAAAGLRPGQALADAQAILPELGAAPACAGSRCRLGCAAWRIGRAASLRCRRSTRRTDCCWTSPASPICMAERKRCAWPSSPASPAPASRCRWPSPARRIAPRAWRGLGVGIVVPPGEAALAVAPSLQALRLPAASIAALHRLGLRRVGDLLRQPRGPLARRFGLGLLATLDAATGLRPRPLRPLRPPPDFLAARDFLEPLVTREAIDATLALLLPELRRTAGGRPGRPPLPAARIPRRWRGAACGNRHRPARARPAPHRPPVPRQTGEAGTRLRLRTPGAGSPCLCAADRRASRAARRGRCLPRHAPPDPGRTARPPLPARRGLAPGAACQPLAGTRHLPRRPLRERAAAPRLARQRPAPGASCCAGRCGFRRWRCCRMHRPPCCGSAEPPGGCCGRRGRSASHRNGGGTGQGGPSATTTGCSWSRGQGSGSRRSGIAVPGEETQWWLHGRFE
ncbi:hypothetical protein [Dankookia sp. P2]|uniref:hypothetical protein n=1 Tax=Dankookia sp. P2 TaxID=3423955 RepID=UPI003D6660B1